jgi:hypothetical protein
VLVAELGGELGPAADAELGVDGLGVVLDRVSGDTQRPGYLLVGGTPGEQAGDLALTRGQAVQCQPHYYRIQGPRVLAEYNNQRGGNHIHTVWRDPAGDFGRDLLAHH